MLYFQRANLYITGFCGIRVSACIAQLHIHLQVVHEMHSDHASFMIAVTMCKIVVFIYNIVYSNGKNNC